MKENLQAYKKVHRVYKRIVGKKVSYVIELTEEASKKLPEALSMSNWSAAVQQELRQHILGVEDDYLGFGTDCAWRGGIGKDE